MTDDVRTDVFRMSIANQIQTVGYEADKVNEVSLLMLMNT